MIDNITSDLIDYRRNVDTELFLFCMTLLLEYLLYWRTDINFPSSKLLQIHKKILTIILQKLW